MNQTQMDAIRAKDEKLARARRPARGEGLQYSVDKRAVMRAVRSEGAEILTEAGGEYWRDQERKYPALRGPRTDVGDSPDGTRNRFGRVAYRAVVRGGVLVRERRVGNEWVRVF